MGSRKGAFFADTACPNRPTGYNKGVRGHSILQFYRKYNVDEIDDDKVLLENKLNNVVNQLREFYTVDLVGLIQDGHEKRIWATDPDAPSGVLTVKLLETAQRYMETKIKNWYHSGNTNKVVWSLVEAVYKQEGGISLGGKPNLIIIVGENNEVLLGSY